MKRAITLGGGGPAAGLQLGALKCFRDYGITFDIWALSCVGVWVGSHYNLAKDPATAPEETIAHFRENVFRDDVTYDKFPITQGFVPDIENNMAAMWKFMMDPASYRNLYAPEALKDWAQTYQKFLSDPKYWNPHAGAQLFTAFAAANPALRFMTSMIWKSEMKGLAGGAHKGAGLSSNMDVSQLFAPDKPFIYHNAWNMTDDRLELFANRVDPPAGMQKLSATSMRACSALPYLIEPVEMNGKVYCEGALVRTVEFGRIIDDHPDLEEIWVVRIVDPRQVRPTRNLDDAMNNLAMLFAGSLGESNVAAFEEKVKNDPDLRGRIRIRVVPVSHEINYDWNHSNFDLGVEQGYAMARQAVEGFAADA